MATCPGEMANLGFLWFQKSGAGNPQVSWWLGWLKDSLGILEVFEDLFHEGRGESL